MVKKTPQHIKAKRDRINRMMGQIVDLNQEVEKWLEDSGVTSDGFDFIGKHREYNGYWIVWPEELYAEIDKKLGEVG